MWENLRRVDWSRLTHAYGHADNMPTILRNMISPNEKAQAKGWDDFWGAINHQGDYYDATVAGIPFLIEAVSDSRTPGRAKLLHYFRDRWRDASEYGGDPELLEPPGGVDIPTPMLPEGELGPEVAALESNYDEEFDIEEYRAMDLCAWQTGRAIKEGRPVFEKLLHDADPQVASAAASILLLWPETCHLGKESLVRKIESIEDPVEQAHQILEFGTYSSPEDVANFQRWTAPDRPLVSRAAAALAWAWAVEPDPLPEVAAKALEDASAATADAFAKLPWEGIWHRGPWILPSNAAAMILRLADHENDEIRWRAVQGLALRRVTAQYLSLEQIVPVLVRRLFDGNQQVREAAALALSQRGDTAFARVPNLTPTLIQALGNSSPSVCGHAARMLAGAAHQLSPADRTAALKVIDRAAAIFAKQTQSWVQFDSMGTETTAFLTRQRELIAKPKKWDVPPLLIELNLPDKQDGVLPQSEVWRRLAEMYAQSPRQTLAAAIYVAGDESNRNAVMGASNWLKSLGPAAESSLATLDSMENSEIDNYAKGIVRSAAAFIRRSLQVDPETEAGNGSAVVRERTAWVNENTQDGDVVPGLIAGLAHHDPYIRARAAELLRERSVGEAVPALEKLLDDDESVEVGITGAVEFAEQTSHWHKRRVSPRVAAIETLFALDRLPPGDKLLRAMIAESSRPAIVCGNHVVPVRFSVAQWRTAADLAGDRATAIRQIRAARQASRSKAWSGEDQDYVAAFCEAELKKVIDRLSGRVA